MTTLRRAAAGGISLLLLAGFASSHAFADTSHNPTGGIDTFSQVTNGVQISGAASDPDNPTGTIQVQVTVDGTVTRTITANGSAHSHHAYYTVLPALVGQHAYCAVAVNVGPGSNTTLGCRTATFNWNPTGILETAAQQGQRALVTGAASDANTSAPISVRIQVDGSTLATVLANAAIHRGHGFGAYVAVPGGTHTVCAVGVNVGIGADTNLGCRTVTMVLSPFGNLDTLARSGTSALSVSGWAMDGTNYGTALSIVVSIDGAPHTTVANLLRSDVARAYPGTGDHHGFAATIGLSAAEHVVCVTAVGLRAGVTTSLGCRTVYALHPTAPAAPGNPQAYVGSGSVTVSWTIPYDGGAPIGSFRITSTPTTSLMQVPATSTSATITGLVANTSYTFTIVATNPFGAGAPATTAAVRTLGATPPQNTPAPVSTSRYTRNISGAGSTMLTQMYNEGAADAAANPSGHSYLILLDIGGQDEADQGVVLTAGVRFVSYANLVANLKSYVDGYAHAQRANAPILIALGTNNDMDTSASSGASWANNVVDPVLTYATRYPGVRIAGADDMEPGFRASMSATKSWLQGYLGATSAPFVFNGSADGCNWTAPNGTCNNGWTHAGLYYLAGGAAPTRIINLPQIYNTTMAAQWKYISLTGVGAGAPRINFGGPLTEYTACAQAGSCYSMTGHDAWTALWNQLQSSSALRVASLPFSTDLRIDS